MDVNAPWEDYLHARFPGYLLPESARVKLSADEAARFLSALTGRPNTLETLRAISLLVGHAEDLQRFAEQDLPAFVRVLPSQSLVEERRWTGGFHGRIAIAKTNALHAAGATTSFVTQSRRRTFDLPENIFVRATAQRLLALVTDLRRADVLPSKGWGATLCACESPLRRLLGATLLREIPVERLSPMHLAAAAAARHPTYDRAIEWHRRMVDGLDETEPTRIAKVVAEGALAPLSAPTRFELAVAVRLAEAIVKRLDAAEPGAWSLERRLVVAGRSEIVEMTRADGAVVKLFYNQAVLDSGAFEAGVAHYLGYGGRMRPDVTVVVRVGERVRATVIEVKLSDDVSYLARGLQEATLYRWEYARVLTGWPKAILVTSAPIAGAHRPGDDVIAVDWQRWVPEDVADGVVRDVLTAS